MFNKLKKSVDNELRKLINHINKRYALSKSSPLLFNSMKNFIIRDGKRVRPILFIIGYKGFSKKNPKNLYRSALAIELLHDFLLVHDDIVDNADLRRNKPSMHRLLADKIKNRKRIKFSGKDLAIIVGDIMYAIAIECFLSIDEKPERKEKALIKFIEAASYTGCGEFIELLYSCEHLDKINPRMIFKIYDYKTAYYTFIAPLITGAILAGATRTETKKLYNYGLSLGRAFQIKDDILGLFGDEKKTGKSGSSDLEDGKRTLLIWYAYKNGTKNQKAQLERMLSKPRIKKEDILLARKIIRQTGSLRYSQKQATRLLDKSINIIKSSSINKTYRNELIIYSQKLIDLKAID